MKAKGILIGLVAIAFVAIRVILWAIESQNVNEIKNDLIGSSFISKVDTLMLNKDETFVLKTEKETKIGEWDFFVDDNIQVLLKNGGTLRVAYYKKQVLLEEYGTNKVFKKVAEH